MIKKVAREQTSNISFSLIGFQSWIYAVIFYRAGAVPPLVAIPVVFAVVVYFQEVVGNIVEASPSFYQVKRGFEYVVGLLFGISVIGASVWITSQWNCRRAKRKIAVVRKDQPIADQSSPEGIQSESATNERGGASFSNSQSPGSLRAETQDAVWEDPQPSSPGGKESVYPLFRQCARKCEADTVFLLNECTAPLGDQVCQALADQQLLLIKGDILLQTPDQMKANYPTTIHLCAEHADSYKKWTVAAKCQNLDCGEKGLAEWI